MILRFFADTIVILGCGYIGVYISSGIDKRINQLEDLENVFKQLSFNIGFLALPLGEAIYSAAKTQKGVIGLITENISKIMLGRPNITLNIAMEHALKNYEDRLYLTEQELQILKDFSVHTGQGGKKETLDTINAVIAKLHLACANADAERQRNSKLYKGMGFLAGILIVILML